MPKKKKPAEMALKQPSVKHHAFCRFGAESIGITLYDNGKVCVTLYENDKTVMTRTVDMKGE